MRPRYYIIETRGYSVGVGSRKVASSFAVLDRDRVHLEVASFYCQPHGGIKGDGNRRRAAERECARLNAIEASRRAAA